MGSHWRAASLFVFVLSKAISFAKREIVIEYIPTNRYTDYTYLDLMIGEDMYYDCYLGEDAFLKFESYRYPVKQKKLSDTSSNRISIFRMFDKITFKISNLQADDSGTYACFSSNASSRAVTKLAVHDPMKFLWTFLERGMAPTRYIELGGTRAFLKWSQWSECDGCVGHGERRRFGYCYTRSRTSLRQCLDYEKLRLHMRYVAKRKANEILVETCFKECNDDEDIFKPLSKLPILVENGDGLDLVCPGNISARTVIRWERQYYTMLRKDVSFGYGPAMPYYITRKNDLQIHNIDFAGSSKIVISCVVWRQERYDFELSLLLETNKVTETIEHLRVMAISCVIQFAIFLVIILVIDGMKAFAEGVSLKAGRANG